MGVSSRAASRTAVATKVRRKRTKPLQPSYTRGRQTQESIMTAAETVLVRFGHAGFTMKRVADCAGIAIGNLSYHFPTKDSLLESLIDQTLTEYSNRFATLVPEHPQSTAGALGQLVTWFMEDSTTSRYTHLFRELWAAALHSPALNAALDRFYDQSISDVLNRMAAPAETLRRAELKTIVYLMCVLSEGSSVMFGSSLRSRELFQDLKSAAARMIVALVESLETSRPRRTPGQ